MITIEEKIRLFTKILYDGVERENKKTVEEFNREFSNIIAEKTMEFKSEADELWKRSKDRASKESFQIISKARFEAKKIILEREKRLVSEAVKAVKDYAEGYTQGEEYADYFKSILEDMKDEKLQKDEITVYVTERDLCRFDKDIKEAFNNEGLDIAVDDLIIGGLMVIDNKRHIKIDMSISTRIDEAREFIGYKVAQIFE